MPRIPRPPPPIPHTFFFQTPVQMLAKLHWDRQHLKRTLGPSQETFGSREAGYATFNFAVTALHLIDWTFRSLDAGTLEDAFAHMAPTQVEWFAKLNAEERQPAFTKALYETHDLLRVCHDLANGDKHRGLEKPKCAQLQAKVHRTWREDLGEFVETYRLVISDGENDYANTAFFDAVIMLWERLLSNWGFLEHHFWTDDDLPHDDDH